MMESMTLFSLLYLWFIFYEGDSIYSLSTYNTPCFLSNLVSFYAPFGPPSYESDSYEEPLSDEISMDGSDSYEEPLSDEISMDGVDSHEEPPINQQ